MSLTGLKITLCRLKFLFSVSEHKKDTDYPFYNQCQKKILS
jgi:hypothetical protein